MGYIYEKKKRKKQKGLGWWQRLASGDPQKEIDFFNHVMGSDQTDVGSADGSAVGDGMAEMYAEVARSPETVIEAIYALDMLDEAQFRDSGKKNGGHTGFHYNKHILADGEEFSYSDPKFPSTLTQEQYIKDAEELTLAPAGSPRLWEKKLGNGADVIGFVKTDGRFVKMRPSKYRDGFLDVVIYIERGYDDQIFTYMLSRRSKYWEMYSKQYKEELPENK